MTELPTVYSAVLFALAVMAGIYDIRFRRIPNWLTLSGIVAGLALNTTMFGLRGLGTSFAGFGLAAAIYFILYAVRGMGAGDVKLMAAIGSVTGPGTWFQIFILTALLGAVLAIVVVVAKGRLRRTLWNVAFMLRQFISFRVPYMQNPELDVRSDKALRMPHGAVIALGTLAVIAVHSMAL